MKHGQAVYADTDTVHAFGQFLIRYVGFRWTRNRVTARSAGVFMSPDCRQANSVDWEETMNAFRIPDELLPIFVDFCDLANLESRKVN